MVVGDAVQTARLPALGTGLLLTLQPQKVRVFFLRDGETALRPDMAGLHAVSPTAAEDAVFAVLRELQPWGRAHGKPHHRVYAIELSDQVRLDAAFRSKNPLMRRDRLCLYVGGTGLTPEQRFQNHRNGHKSSWYASRFGVDLRPDLYGHFPAVSWDRCQRLEPAFAELLREWGHGVWQN